MKELYRLTQDLHLAAEAVYLQHQPRAMRFPFSATFCRLWCLGALLPL